MSNTPTLRDLVASAGYYRIDIKRLLSDLHQQPGCETVKSRTLYNYLNGTSTPRGAVLLGLSRVLNCQPEQLI